MHDNSLFSGNLLTSSLANSADPVEMPHCAAFHQGLQCLLELKKSSLGRAVAQW